MLSNIQPYVNQCINVKQDKTLRYNMYKRSEGQMPRSQGDNTTVQGQPEVKGHKQ